MGSINHGKIHKRNFFYQIFIAGSIGILLVSAAGAQSADMQTTPIAGNSPRSIDFSGYTWYVKDYTENLAGPGPNYFNDSEDQVWVDSNEYLHLSINQTGGQWQCSEVYTEESFGYGTYVYSVAPGALALDPMMILGLFSYYNDTQEIDHEVAQWGDPEANNAQYALQPAHIKGNLEQYSLSESSEGYIFVFTWCAEYIIFQTFEAENTTVLRPEFGNFSDHPSVRHQWAYRGEDIPLERTERVHINLWLMGGGDPQSGQPFEIIIREFDYLSHECDTDALEGFKFSTIAGFPWITTVTIVIGALHLKWKKLKRTQPRE